MSQNKYAHTPIHHVGLAVSDLERSITFYRDVLSLELVLTNEGSRPGPAPDLGTADVSLKTAFLRAGSVLLELLQFRNPLGRSNDRRLWDVGTAHVAFAVDDLEAAYQTLETKGIVFSSAPIRFTEGPLQGSATARFADPDGIPLQIFQQGTGKDSRL